MTILVAALAVLAFMAALEGLGVVKEASVAVASSRSGAGLFRDASLTEEEKEQAMRAASLSLFRSFVAIALRSAGAFALSLVPVFAAAAAGATSVEDVSTWLMSLQGIVAMSVLVAVWIAVRRLW